MVGYNKNDTLTTNQKLIAGCMSGMITRFITQPMDVIKVRTQLQKPDPRPLRKKKWFWTPKKILKEEGLFAFWQGHNLGQFHSVMSVSSQFYVYELATRYVTNATIDNKYKHFLYFGSGILAGCCSAFLVIPLEVIRVRQMLVQDQYKGILNGARKVYKTGGILAFYEGLSASLLQMGPQVGIAFTVFSFIQPRLLRYLKTCPDGTNNCPQKPEHVFLASSVSGAIAGFVSKTMTYPFDLTKRRLQISSHRADTRYNVPSTVKRLFRCKNLRECFIKTYQAEGFLGLFKGWSVTVYKAQLTSVTAFTSYELSCFFINKFFNEV